MNITNEIINEIRNKVDFIISQTNESAAFAKEADRSTLDNAITRLDVIIISEKASCCSIISVSLSSSKRQIASYSLSSIAKIFSNIHSRA